MEPGQIRARDLGMDIRGTLTQNLRLMGFKTYMEANESWAALPDS